MNGDIKSTAKQHHERTFCVKYINCFEYHCTDFYSREREFGCISAVVNAKAQFVKQNS
jgi:hypothetical protein